MLDPNPGCGIGTELVIGIAIVSVISLPLLLARPASLGGHEEGQEQALCQRQESPGWLSSDQRGLGPGCYQPTRPISAGGEPRPATDSAASRAHGPTHQCRETNSRRRMRRFASSATVWCPLATSPPKRRHRRRPVTKAHATAFASRTSIVRSAPRRPVAAPRGRSLTLRKTARPGPPQRLFPRARSCGGFPPGGLSRYARTSPRPGGNTCRTRCRLQRPR